MTEFLSYHEIDAATDAVRARLTTEPQIALILGSGLGELAESIENRLLSHEIPFWPQSTVPGHKGRLVIGNWKASKFWFFRDGRIITKATAFQNWAAHPCNAAFGNQNFDLTNASVVYDDFYRAILC